MSSARLRGRGGAVSSESSQWNVRHCADSGPPRGDRRRRAIRPWTKPRSRRARQSLGRPHRFEAMALRHRRRSLPGKARLRSCRESLFELDSGRVKRPLVVVLDIVERLRQEFRGNRQRRVFRDWQRDLLSGRAVEVVHAHHPIDDEVGGQTMVVRLFDRAWSDTHRDDPDRLVFSENRVILRRRQNPVEGGIPGRGVRSVHAELGHSESLPHAKLSRQAQGLLPPLNGDSRRGRRAHCGHWATVY